MNIRHLDLNLLVVFEAIMQTGSLTAAGQRLGQAQPTVSHALNRLRRMVGDPLFVRAARGVLPTPVALRLAEPVAEALDLLRGGLARAAAFNPATAQAHFTLLMSDIGQTHLLPALVREIDRTAPGVTLSAIQLPRGEYGAALQSGRADIAIGGLGALNAGFYRQKLFTDRYVGVIAAESPFADTVSIEDYLEARHVGIISSGFSDLEIDRLLLPPGRSRNVVVKVPHFLAAPELVPGTSLVVTVPSRATILVRNRADIRTVQIDASRHTLTVYQCWHERSHDDDAGRWLRGLVGRLFSDHTQA